MHARFEINSEVFDMETHFEIICTQMTSGLNPSTLLLANITVLRSVVFNSGLLYKSILTSSLYSFMTCLNRKLRFSLPHPVTT